MLVIYAPTLTMCAVCALFGLRYPAGVNKCILSRLGDIFLAPCYLNGERK